MINVASFVAKLGAATPQLAYTASKGAVLAMTRELAMIHAREGIRFNSLCPGPIRTPLLMDFLNTPEKLNRRMVHCPMGRFGEAVEQAKAVVFREYTRAQRECTVGRLLAARRLRPCHRSVHTMPQLRLQAC